MMKNSHFEHIFLNFLYLYSSLSGNCWVLPKEGKMYETALSLQKKGLVLLFHAPIINGVEHVDPVFSIAGYEYYQKVKLGKTTVKVA
jgi:hypothetical protein